MVYMNNEENELEVETTSDDIESEETELIDVEEKSGDKIKKLQDKLRHAEEAKRDAQDELQRTRADFLNARRRLEEERDRDKVRHRKKHIEELLPLCDSFQMAMDNTETWEKAEPAWRKGFEGINAQLMGLLDSYGVKVIAPVGEVFDPHRDEAIGTEVVTDKKLVDTVVSVVQRGYEIEVDGKTEVIRHARVTIGIMKD
jgi:molecular chaperone GrpE